MASPLKRSLTVVVLLALMAVPPLVTARLGAPELAGSSVLACVTGLLAAVLVPLRIAGITAALLAVGTAAAVPVSDVPWLAGLLMAGCGVAMGFAAKAGAVAAVTLAPITVAFMLSDPPARSALAVGLCVLGSAAFGVGLGALVHRRLPERGLTPMSTERAAAYGATLALLAGAAGYFVSALSPGHAGAWVLLTLFVVIQPYLQDGWRKSIERAAGTVLGFAIAMVVGLLTDLEAVIFAVGLVAMIVGTWLRIKNHPYWEYTAALTVGVVMSEGASTSVISTAEQRLLATVIGVGASLLAMAVLEPVYKRGAEQAGLDRY